MAKPIANETDSLTVSSSAIPKDSSMPKPKATGMETSKANSILKRTAKRRWTRWGCG